MQRLLLVTIDYEFTHRRRLSEEDYQKVLAAGQQSMEALRDLGLEVTNCQVDLGETAGAVLAQALKDGTYDLVLIGAGIRTSPEFTALFETLVNVVHRHAPAATFVFNGSRDDSPDAVLRAIEWTKGLG